MSNIHQINDTRNELFNVFAQNSAGKPQSWLKGKIKRVFPIEPFGGNIEKPASLTIHYAGDSKDDLSMNFEIRLYVDASNDALKSALLIAEIMEIIDYGNTQYGGNISYLPSKFGVPAWECTFEEDLKAHGAIGRLTVGREDF